MARTNHPKVSVHFNLYTDRPDEQSLHQWLQSLSGDGLMREWVVLALSDYKRQQDESLISAEIAKAFKTGDVVRLKPHRGHDFPSIANYSLTVTHVETDTILVIDPIVAGYEITLPTNRVEKVD